jgi:hypothetical protein
MEDILLDKDGNFVVAANGDVQTVQGLKCVEQDAKHRLLTFPGDLWAHLTYGAGIQYFIHAEDNEINRLELEQVIRMALREDDRIDGESIKVEIQSWERDVIRVKVTFNLSRTALENNGEIPEEEATIILTISQTGIEFEGDVA